MELPSFGQFILRRLEPGIDFFNFILNFHISQIKNFTIKEFYLILKYLKDKLFLRKIKFQNLSCVSFLNNYEYSRL